MKKVLPLAILAAVLVGFTGCFTYERTTPSRTVVVEQTAVGPTDRVITVLPTGYTTRVYRGTTYYTYRDTYYRSVPGGYVVTTRPW